VTASPLRASCPLRKKLQLARLCKSPEQVIPSDVLSGEQTLQDICHLSFAAQNVNSLNISTNCPKKLHKVSAILALNAYIIFLSDTRLNTSTSGNNNIFSPGYDMYSNSTSSKRGVCILISRKLDYTVEREHRDEKGNILCLLVKFNNTRILLCSIYGPNANDPGFFRYLSNTLDQYRGIPMVGGGDWNLTYSTDPTENNIDILNMKNPPSVFRSEQLMMLCEKFDLCDPYRAMNYARRDFSYVPRAGTKNRSRLDFFIVSESLLGICTNCSISPSLNSSLFDHKSISMHFMKEKKCGKIFVDNMIFCHPRFNAVVATAAVETYLQHAQQGQEGLVLEEGLMHIGNIIDTIHRANDLEFDIFFLGMTPERELQLSGLNAEVNLLVDDLPVPEQLNSLVLGCNDDTFLEILMGNIRNAIISFQTWIKKVRNARSNAITKSLNELKNDHKINHGRISELESELCELREAALRSKIQEMKLFENLHNERPSPLFLNLIKKSNNNNLSRIARDDGSPFPTQKDRTDFIVSYYEKVYDKNKNKENRNFQVDFEGCIERFLGDDITNHPLVQGSKLTRDERELLDSPLTLQELDNSLSECNLKSAPGMDGFSNRLIRECWKYLRMPLHKYALFCFDTGTLTPNFRNACIKLIPKKGEISQLKNWRPISLLSNMYKILSRAINTRLQKINNRICSRAQKGYNDKRYVQEVLINVCESINYCQKNNINGSVLAIDMAKAFDTLDHDFINEVYKFFGFGPNIIRWLNLCGNNRTACIILEDNSYSRSFNLGCGRPQGDNTSPCTFNFCEQILIFKLELSPHILRIPRVPLQVAEPINPFLFESNRETDANESLADDNTLLSLVNKDSLSCVKGILHDFYNISGLKCNYEKTMIMPMLLITDSDREMLEDLGLKVVSKIKLLGATIYRDLEKISENFLQVKEKVRNTILYWERFRLSLPGRLSIAKTYLISQINYLGCFFTIEEGILNEIQALVNSFIKKNLSISDDRMYLPPELGGLGFFKINEFLMAQKCMWIFRTKRYTIDNWRHDICALSPSFNPLLVRTIDAKLENHPILAGLVESYEKFYACYTARENNYKHAYIFRNSTICDPVIDVNFFGQMFYNNHLEKIRGLKFSDCFRGSAFKSPEEFARDGLPVSLATWLRLRNCLISARRRLHKTEEGSGEATIEDFCNKFKKGSKKIRLFFSLFREALVKLTESRSYATFVTLINTTPRETQFLGYWTAVWHMGFLPNDLRAFIFNLRYNYLPLNNRLNAYRPEINPKCTFCRIRDKDTAPRDSLRHCFFTCPTTKQLLTLFLAHMNVNMANEDFNLNQLYWFGISSELENTKQTIVVLSVVFDVFRFILFRHRLRSNIPNFNNFFREITFTLSTIIRSNKRFRDSFLQCHTLAPLTQALG
jgi:exonuclease III